MVKQRAKTNVAYISLEAEGVDGTSVIVDQEWVGTLEDCLHGLANEFEISDYLEQVPPEEADELATRLGLSQYPVRNHWHLHITRRQEGGDIHGLLINSSGEMWWATLPQLMDAIYWWDRSGHIGVTCPQCGRKALHSDPHVISHGEHESPMYACPKCGALTTMAGEQMANADGTPILVGLPSNDEETPLW